MYKKTHKRHYRRHKNKKTVSVVKTSTTTTQATNALRFPGFPPTTRAKLRYVECFDISNSYTQQIYAYRANGCYDPRMAIGGHQPIGWDQWTPFYNHYVVVGAKMTVRLTSGNSNNNSDAIIAFINLADDDTIPGTSEELLEQGKVRYKLVSGNMQTQRALALTQTYSPKNYFNIVDIKDNLDRLGANVQADPAEAAVFVFGTQGVTAGGTYGGELQCIVQIDYLVEFSEPKQLASS